MSQDNERLKIILGFCFGFCVLFILGFLAYRIAYGNVDEAHSFGLIPIISSLSTLAGGFSTWIVAVMRNDAKPNLKPEGERDPNATGSRTEEK